jgi:hypothetical protein
MAEESLVSDSYGVEAFLIDMTSEGHTLEKLKIHERLADIEVTVAKMYTQIENERGNHQQIIHNLSNIISRHDKLLYGNGDGVQLRVDRLEEFKKQRIEALRDLKAQYHRIWFGIFSLMLGLFGKILYDFFNLLR